MVPLCHLCPSEKLLGNSSWEEGIYDGERYERRELVQEMEKNACKCGSVSSSVEVIGDFLDFF